MITPVANPAMEPTRYRTSIRTGNRNPLEYKPRKTPGNPCLHRWIQTASPTNLSTVMSRLHYVSPEGSSWTAARISSPLAVPAGLGGTDATDPEPTVLIVPLNERDAALLSKPDSGVRVNGHPVLAGIHLLSDRDEIRLKSGRYYFSSNDPLVVENMESNPVNCPRCSGRIDTGTSAVRCHCGAWFHQSDEHPCFTYGQTCPLCGASSQLDTDPWDPSTI